jgi:hypothetical protein
VGALGVAFGLHLNSTYRKGAIENTKMENFSELDTEDQALVGLLRNELDTAASEEQSRSATPLENTDHDIAAGQVNNSAMAQFQVYHLSCSSVIIVLTSRRTSRGRMRSTKSTSRT